MVADGLNHLPWSNPHCVVGSMIGAEVALVSLALLVVAMLYSSVGHGGASGYLAIMSLATIGTLSLIHI